MARGNEKNVNKKARSMKKRERSCVGLRYHRETDALCVNIKLPNLKEENYLK